MDQKAAAPSHVSSRKQIVCTNILYFWLFIHIFTKMSKVRIKFGDQKCTRDVAPVFSIDNMCLICWHCAPV